MKAREMRSYIHEHQHQVYEREASGKSKLSHRKDGNEMVNVNQCYSAPLPFSCCQARKSNGKRKYGSY
ncbi:hypothetical protein LOK49_LG03G03918 [Camellia lanceoleosa]|uniref:Uncharacterized protein n=1 Tax=Camellia lanceoleosa TaxID=1840588 RepID=A0ACC0I7F9_9ERIC|nr:hypothetical protein LOK49_LG03G03918 [Camellia lanceoleosa]